MTALGKVRRCSKQMNPSLKTCDFLPKKSRIQNILVTFKLKVTKEDRVVKLRARMNKLFPSETKIFKKRIKSPRMAKITFIREYNSVLSDMSIINYGTFDWDGKNRILQPATNSSKRVWVFSALVSVILLFAYTSAMLLSDYVDVSKLEIRNLAVISSDELLILTQVYMLALELNSFYFNSQIIESINAMLQLQEYAMGQFEAIGEWNRSFTILVKSMRLFRHGWFLLSFLFFFRKTSVEVLFGFLGLTGRIAYAIIGLISIWRIVVNLTFYITVNLGCYEFLQFWIRQVIKSTKKDQTLENLERCMKFYQMLMIQQKLQDGAFGQFYLPIGSALTGGIIFWTIICLQKFDEAHFTITALFISGVSFLLVSLYLQYSSCSIVQLLSQQCKHEFQKLAIRDTSNAAHLPYAKLAFAYNWSLRPMSIKVGEFGIGSIGAFFRITVEMGNYYVLVMRLYA